MVVKWVLEMRKKVIIMFTMIWNEKNFEVL